MSKYLRILRLSLGKSSSRSAGQRREVGCRRATSHQLKHGCPPSTPPGRASHGAVTSRAQWSSSVVSSGVNPAAVVCPSIMYLPPSMSLHVHSHVRSPPDACSIIHLGPNIPRESTPLPTEYSVTAYAYQLPYHTTAAHPFPPRRFFLFRPPRCFSIFSSSYINLSLPSPLYRDRDSVFWKIKANQTPWVTPNKTGRRSTRSACLL